MPPEQVGWPGPGQPEYLFRMPTTVPRGRVLVHNSARPRRTIGLFGFRAWFDEPDEPRLVQCECGWAPEFAEHYTVPDSRPVTDDSD